MLSADLRAAQAVMELRLDEANRAADSRKMVESAGLDPSGWLRQRGCQLLCQLGQRLVAAGERLEQYSLPEVQLAEG